jgi:hypothetical protein
VRIPGPVFEFVEVPEEHDLLSEECTRLEVTRLEIHPPQAGDKVVVELEVRRFGPDGTELEAEGVVCLITRHSERWGLQLCSTRSALPGLP